MRDMHIVIESLRSHPGNESSRDRSITVYMPGCADWVSINGHSYSRRAAEELITVLDLMLGDNE